MSNTLERLSAALAGRYRLDREIGQGGMATVYLAHDVRHDRDVALKVLHPELGAVIGAERFLAEIKVTARLQHPHILGLIDSGEADGLLFYVMPFVSGESLRARLQREKQLPMSEVIRIATEVAGALHYAHRQGVVHRDIKPENILLHDGQALVADFGIALALTSAGGGRMTQTGMSLGTPHYMSPEQAMGEREITARSDVYALGAMTYEMVTGDPPFTGSTNQAIMAKVMTERPLKPSATRDTVPPHVDAAILTALAKLPADRWGTTKEFADALANPSITASHAAFEVSAQRRKGARIPRSGLLALATLVVGAGLGWLLRRPPALATYPVEFYVEPDSTHTMELNTFAPLALAPDGSRLAYLGRSKQGVVQLYERRLEERDARPIEGTAGADHPFYSPDGEWIAYDDGGLIKKVRVAGGAPVTVTRIEGNTTGGVWGPDGTIVYSSGVPRRLFRVASEGGTPEELTKADATSGENHVRPSMLPDGHTVLFTSFQTTTSTARLGVLSLESRTVKYLAVPALIPKYVASGELLYVLEDGALVAQHFDLRRLEVSGPVRRLAESVTSFARIAPTFDAAYSGVIAYRPGGGAGTVLVSVDRQGKESVVLAGPDLWAPRYSPKGERIAYARAGSSSVGRDIWVHSIVEASATRISHDFANAVDPSWRADGQQLLFSAGSTGAMDLYVASPDGGSSPTRVVNRPGDQFQGSFARDGRRVVFTDVSPSTRGDILGATLDSAGAATPLVQTSFDEVAPSLSPDGKWLAYSSSESGQVEIYVRAYPGPGPRAIISNDGGREAAWSPDGREIYYRVGSRLMAASIETGTTVTVRNRVALFDGNYLPGRTNRNFDVHPDGQHFLFVKAPAQQRLVVRLGAVGRTTP